MTRFRIVRSAILKRRRHFMLSLFWALVAIVLPIALKFALDSLVDGLPYMTSFPAVLLAAIFLGGRWAGVVSLGLAAAVNYFFMPPRFGWSLDGQHLIGAATFLFASALVIFTAETLRGAVRELHARAEREQILNAELQHRVKNSLAVVQGLARQSIPAELLDAFDGRLVALGEAHNILATGNWEECALPAVAQAALKPFHQPSITLTGPACGLLRDACVPLILALHELATNAVKYGALSVPEGRVTLEWHVGDGVAQLRWRERGGPRVEAPTRRGLGSRLLREQNGLDRVRVEYQPEGITCDIAIKLAGGATKAGVGVGHDLLRVRRVAPGRPGAPAVPTRSGQSFRKELRE